jgi:ferredoxin-NADP reductase/DMSO/TMAO reductase YedYZ heme-binding membrane subunit
MQIINQRVQFGLRLLTYFLYFSLIISFIFIDYNYKEIGALMGRLSIYFFWLLALAGILNRYKPKGDWGKIREVLIFNRRQIGILMFTFGLLHYLWSMVFNAIKFGIPEVHDIFIPIGLFALVLSLPLFLTSNNFAVRLMGVWWKRLHLLVYPIMILLIFHTSLQGGEHFVNYGIPSLVLLGFWIYSFFYKPKIKYAEVKLEVVNVRSTGDKAKIITFKRPKNYVIKPASHINLKLNIKDQIVSRSYSVCDIKNNVFSIGVKRQEGGLVSNYINDNFEVGTIVNASYPFGVFYNQVDINEINQINLFAGGSGITPFMSMLGDLPLDKVVLYYSNKSIQESMLLDELKQVGVTSKLFFSDTNQITEKDINVSKDSINYICGPEGYIDFIKSVLLKNGILNIKTESFVIKKGEKHYKSQDIVEEDGKYICIDCGYVKEFKKGELFGYCQICNLGLNKEDDVWTKVMD